MDTPMKRGSAAKDGAGPASRGSAEETRRRLIDAGLDAFGRYGFDGASTRDIAKRAGVNLAAIPYHFGGKEGLHTAVAQHIVDEIRGRIGDLFDSVSASIENEDIGPDQARDMLQMIVGRASQVILGHPEASRWAPLILREQMDPTSSFEVLYDGFMGRAHKLITALYARATGQDENTPKAIAGAFALIGQLVIFRMASALVDRRLGWTDYGPDQIALIADILRGNLDAMIEAGRV